MPNSFAAVCSVKLSSGFVTGFESKSNYIIHVLYVMLMLLVLQILPKINICTFKKIYPKITLIAQIVIKFDGVDEKQAVLFSNFKRAKK